MAAVREEHFVVRPSMLKPFPLYPFSRDAVKLDAHSPILQNAKYASMFLASSKAECHEEGVMKNELMQVSNLIDKKEILIRKRLHTHQ